MDREAYREVARELLEALEADGRVAEVTERIDRARLLLGENGEATE